MFSVFQTYIQDKIHLSHEDIEELQKISFVKKLYKRQYLLQEGDVWRYDAFVARGCLRTYARNDNGHEHVMGFAIENWWTGDRESLLSGQPSRLNIDAIEDSEVVLFPHASFERICAEIPSFGTLINTIIQRGFIASQKRIESYLSNTAEQKYSDFLQRYPQIVARVPQAMIASYLGMTPETLSRVRSQLTKK